MNFLGLGPMEVLIVLLVAFIFLGPERMVDAARLLGKAMREVRRMAAELPSLDLDEDDTRPAEGPVVHRGGGPNPGPARQIGGGPPSTDSLDPHESGTASPNASPSHADESSGSGDGPVAFRPARGTTTADDAGPAAKQDRS